MKDQAHNSEHFHLIDEIKDRQSNTLWPDAMKNSRGVDEFLWESSPDAPLVQRMGAWLFGIFFILGGLGWLDVAYEKHWTVFGVLSVAWFLIGGKVFLNGFRRHKVAKDRSK
jgi:hypothetical protein